MMPDFSFEESFQRDLGTDGPIAGVDEAGRGPWAGPVVAAAVCFGSKAQFNQHFICETAIKYADL